MEQQNLRNWPCRTIKFSSSFFPSAIRHWNALDQDTKSAKNVNIFKNKLFKRTRPTRKVYFGILDKNGTRLITLLRMGLSPLTSTNLTTILKIHRIPFVLNKKESKTRNISCCSVQPIAIFAPPSYKQYQRL